MRYFLSLGVWGIIERQSVMIILYQIKHFFSDL